MPLAKNQSNRKKDEHFGQQKKKKKSTRQIFQQINSRSKKKKAKRFQYTEDDLKQAIEAINERGISLRKASRMYHVPVATLSRRKNNIELKRSLGPSTVLSYEEETRIVDWVIYRAETGAPVTKCELLDCVQTYVLMNNIPTPFQNGRPSRHWYEGFRRRHKQIRTRTAQDLTLSRALVYQEDLQEWFVVVGGHLVKYDLMKLPAGRWFNGDESYMPFCPKAAKILAEKGSNVHRIVDQNEREGLTVLFVYAADGTRAPPMVLFPLKDEVPEAVVRNTNPEWGIGNTDNGWMTLKSFFEYVTNVFYPWLIKNKIELPVVFFVDGHTSHATKPLVDFCRARGITLILLPPHATHIMQPLDTSFFAPLKKFWANEVPKWKVQNKVSRLTRVNFPKALEHVLNKFSAKDMLENGFRRCGLFPFNAEAVNYDVLKKKKTKGPLAIVKESCTSQEVCASTGSEFWLLPLFEDSLDPNLLSAFKQAEAVGNWDGAESYKGLYEHWIKMKKPSKGQISQGSQIELVASQEPIPIQELVTSLPQQLHDSNELSPVVRIRTTDDGKIIFDECSSENEDFPMVIDSSLIESELPPELADCFDEEPMQVESVVTKDFIIRQNSSDDQRTANSPTITVENVQETKRSSSNASVDSQETESQSIQEILPRDITCQFSHSHASEHIAQNSANSESDQSTILTQNVNRASPSKCISFKLGKENSSNSESEMKERNFNKVFTFPEEFLPKKEKLKLQQSKRKKKHPVATSDAWAEEYDKREAARKESEEKLAKKKELQAKKKALADERKRLDEEIRALTPKRIKVEKS